MNNYYCGKCGSEALYDIVRDTLLCFDCNGDLPCGRTLVSLAMASEKTVAKAIEQAMEQKP